MSNPIVFKHKQTKQIPRHLQSYSYLENVEHRNGKSPHYSGCLMLAAKTKDRENIDEDEQSISAMSAALEIREKRCEEWLDNYAESVNVQNKVPGHLAFETFAPHDKEKLSSILSKYSGATK